MVQATEARTSTVPFPICANELVPIKRRNRALAGPPPNVAFPDVPLVPSSRAPTSRGTVPWTGSPNVALPDIPFVPNMGPTC